MLTQYIACVNALNIFHLCAGLVFRSNSLAWRCLRIFLCPLNIREHNANYHHEIQIYHARRNHIHVSNHSRVSSSHSGKTKLINIASSGVGLMLFKCVPYKLLERQCKQCTLKLRNNCTEFTS